MSSNLEKFFRSLKGHSDHRGRYEYHDPYGKDHDSYFKHGHHDKSRGRHYFSGLAIKTMTACYGKIVQNKRLALLVIIGLLTVAALLMVCAVWLVVTLFKVCGSLVSNMETSGLKGVLETLSKMLAWI
jgi:hypothetical protein